MGAANPRAAAMNPVERRFSRCGENRYVLDVSDLCVVLDVDRVHRDRWGALRGELTVRCDLPGATTIDGVLWSGEMSFTDTRTKQDITRQLASRAKARDLDWSMLVDELGMRVRDAERGGQPAVLLRDVARPAPDEHLVVDGLRLLKRHPVVIFGDGGSAKSYLALYLAGRLDQTGLKIGLFDWELGAEDHRDRLERLFGEHMPGVFYARCTRPLTQELDRITRIIHTHRLDYAILDSVAFACDGPPEAAEVASDYLRATRSLGIGSLHLAHVSKAENADQRPFGSTFWHNGARATWYLKRADASPGGEAITIGLFNRKANLGPLQPAVGFSICFADNQTRFSRVNLGDVEGLAAKLSTFERVVYALKRGPLTVAQLADELDAKVDTVEKTVRRWATKGKLVRLEAQNGTPTRYGLAELRRVS
jgi:hypothetical protein